MTRDDILNIVKKYLCEALDTLSPDQIDPGLSMKDLGANSLDIVEVVSCTMRELKVKVPRAELARISNIDGFVDFMEQKVLEKTAAEGVANPKAASG